jgi:LysM repeat protein
MDTISSRESNTNFLPMVGIAVGALALIIAVIVLLKMTGVSKDISELRGISARVDSLESQVVQVSQLGQHLGQISQLAQTVNSTRAHADSIQSATQTVVNQIAEELKQIRARLDRVEGTRSAPVASGGATPARAAANPEPAVAGPDEHIVKSGDIGVSIARANGVSLQALMAVNPDVNWNRLRPGQKIKLPKR